MKDKYSRRGFISKTGITIASAGMAMPGMAKAQEQEQEQGGTNSMMAGGEIDPVEFGKSLSGLGINLLVTDVLKTVEFSEKILQSETIMADKDFAILRRGDIVWMLHGDQTYHSNPLVGFVKGVPGRGQGIELRLYELDPDAAEARVKENGYTMLSDSANKPHGLRECYILDPDGYCWVASRALRDGEE